MDPDTMLNPEEDAKEKQITEKDYVYYDLVKQDWLLENH